jgi:hypothetical protein
MWSQAEAAPESDRVREGLSFWTTEAASYPIENTDLSGMWIGVE